jgi:hypothetical protein
VQSRAPRIGQAYYTAFVQDDFKVTRDLLLNIGLRYDIDEPRNEAHGDFSNFSPARPNPGAGLDQAFPAFAPLPNLDPTQANGQVLGGRLASEYVAPFMGRPETVYNWGAEVQQQIVTGLIFTLAYIGTTGTYLHSNLLQVNDLNPRYFGYGAALNNNYAATPGIAAPYAALAGRRARRFVPSRNIRNPEGEAKDLLLFFGAGAV